jgi:hypothetical protein
MVFQARCKSITRAGEQHRANEDRFVFVRATGWFLHVRTEVESVEHIETHAGFVGPFVSKREAQRYLSLHIEKENSTSLG